MIAGKHRIRISKNAIEDGQYGDRSFRESIFTSVLFFSLYDENRIFKCERTTGHQTG